MTHRFNHLGEAIGEPVRAEMQAAVFHMHRTRLVLGELDHRAVRTSEAEKIVSRTTALDLGHAQAPGNIGLAQAREIIGFETHMHQARMLSGLVHWIKLDELAIVDLQELFTGRAVAGEFEGALEPEELIEAKRSLKVGHTQGNMSN